MNEIQAFETMLMSLMRNTAGVRAALARLGVHDSALPLTKRLAVTLEWLHIELDDAYDHPFLGPPLRIASAAYDGRPLEKLYYWLPEWPEFELELTTSRKVIGGVRFVRAADAAGRALQPPEIKPWNMVEDDLELSCSSTELVERFFSAAEYRCRISDTDVHEYCLSFDYGLLQVITPWNDPNVRKAPVDA